MIIEEVIRQNPIVRYIYEKLSSIVLIKPYYLHQEVLLEEGTLNPQLKLDHCTVGFLTPTKIKGNSANPEVLESEDILLERPASGCQCFGIKHDGDCCLYVV